MRAVFDTNTVISALLFRGSLAWLVPHWQSGEVTPLVSRETAGEILRVLAYPKFRLTESQANAFAARYLPYAERIETAATETGPWTCRDAKDHPFLLLATAGNADILISGDGDLLALRGQTPFGIETPEQYCARFPRLT